MAASSSRGAVVITGASTGIGEACAMRLARGGFDVFAGVRRDADGERLRAGAEGLPLTPIIIDVTDEATIRAAAARVGAALGARGIAGLVNNAGISVAGPMEFIPMARLRHQLEVNFFGQVAVTQAFMPLIRQARGRIVNMGSIGGRMATPFLGPYNVSKYAMEAFTDSLRQELRMWGIHVAVIEPGSIATPIWEKGISSADELERELPAEATNMYRKSIDALRKTARKFEARGIPPDVVAKAVEHALTAGTPKTRYLVGRDARLQALIAKFVPDRLRDRAVASQIGLPRKP